MNKFSNFQICTVYAKLNRQGFMRYDKMLVDKEAGKLIYCRYDLPNSKSATSDGVSCFVLELPMTEIDGGVEVCHSSLVHKLNSKHYKKVSYDDLILEHQRDFAVFL